MKFGGRQKGTPNKRTEITENLTLPNRGSCQKNVNNCKSISYC